MTLLIFASILLLLAVIAVVVQSQPQGRHVSISEHAASRWWTYLLFGTSLTGAGSTLLWFLYHSFGPKLGVPPVYYIFLGIAWVSLVLTAWIPDAGGGRLSKAHKAVAFFLAIMMTVLTATLAFATHVGPVTRVTALIAAFWFCYTLYLFFFVKSAHRHFLVYQSINIMTFFVIIIIGALIN